MAERIVRIVTEVALEKYSKEAHAVTMKKIAEAAGRAVTDDFLARGYKVRWANTQLLMHYVRHDHLIRIIKPAVRRLKRVV